MDENQKTIDLVVENLISLQPLLSKSFTKAIRAKTTLTPGAIFVLRALSKYGKMSMSEIGCHLSVHKPHVTILIDRLIDEELVERLSDPSDRRVVFIQITEKGLEAFNIIRIQVSEDLRLKLQVLDADQLNILSLASLQVKELLSMIILEPQTFSGSHDCKVE
jgi:DNA-binding MarR family transcriptional regulator